MKRVKILALLGSFFYIQNSFSATVTVTNNSVHPITYSFYYNNRYYTPTYVRPGVSSTFNSGIHSIRGVQWSFVGPNRPKLSYVTPLSISALSINNKIAVVDRSGKYALNGKLYDAQSTKDDWEMD